MDWEKKRTDNATMSQFTVAKHNSFFDRDLNINNALSEKLIFSFYVLIYKLIYINSQKFLNLF